MSESQQIQETDQQAYNSLAEEYREVKKTAMNSVLQCGKILHDGKERMGSNMYRHFLQDNRVAESERTAHRLVSVYKNFRHILNKPEKLEIFSQLGVSHLLELKKLPQRFTKEIEVVIEKSGESIKEICSVIDEEQLADFLDGTADEKYWDDGQPRKVRDLTAAEMRKVVNEQTGKFEPDSFDYDNEQEGNSGNQEYGTPIPEIESEDSKPFVPKINGAEIIDAETTEDSDETSKEVSTENMANLLEGTDILLSGMYKVISALSTISPEEIEASSEKSKETLSERIPKILSNSEAIIVQLSEFKGKI